MIISTGGRGPRVDIEFDRAVDLFGEEVGHQLIQDLDIGHGGKSMGKKKRGIQGPEKRNHSPHPIVCRFIRQGRRTLVSTKGMTAELGGVEFPLITFS